MTKHGSVLTPNEIDVMADGIANSVIPHFLSTVQILPGTFNTLDIQSGTPEPVLGVGVFL